MTQASSRHPDRAGWPIPLLALALLSWLAFTAWCRPLAVPDEGRYAGVAWEMIRSHDWLTPTLDGLPFFHKPPLFYWLTALSLKVLGLSQLGARMASVLGAVLGGLALYLLVKRWAGVRLAGWSLLILATQPFYFGGAQYANLDMLVAGCISAAIALAAHAVLAREAGQPHRSALWGAYALAGLGMLAKGLIGIVLPGAVIVIWMLLSRRGRRIWSLVSLPGLVVLLIVAAPWFIAMQRLYPGFFDYFFVYQHFQRFTQTGFNNVHKWWFYIPLTLGLCLPWSLAWLHASIGRMHASRVREAGASILANGLKDPGHDGLAGMAGGASGAGLQSPRGFAVLMWVWLAVIIVFFSLPASKLPGYVLPALPPLAFLMAQALCRRWPRDRAVAPIAYACSAALLCVGLVVAAVKYDDQSVKPVLPVMQPLLRQGVPLAYVDDFVYDLPFYLAQVEPIPIISNWDDPHLPRHDNDRKELFDAGRFSRDVARRVLIPRARWAEWLCTHPRLMVMAPREVTKSYPELAWQPPVMALKLWSLWVLDRDDLLAKGLRCPSVTPVTPQVLDKRPAAELGSRP